MTIHSSYHTHNTFCDGEASIEAMVEAGVAAGLSEIGISSHAPLPFPCEWTMPPERLREYVERVQAVAAAYRDRISVRLGLELDYIPAPEVGAFQEREILPLPLDYLIGSVHFLGEGYPPHSFDDSVEDFAHVLATSYGGDIRRMVAEFYRRVRAMAELPAITIVGHLDRIKRFNAGNAFFSAEEAWYRAQVESALDAIGTSGKIVELNTAGWRTIPGDAYPERAILEGCRTRGIPIILSSDAHEPEQMTWGFDRGAALLAEIGIQPRPSLTF